jgi:hypothetical protein
MATRSANQILADIFKAFRYRLPHLQSMGLNFSMDRLRLNQTATAHIEKLPTVGTYSNELGYGANPNDIDDLLEDVPILIDGHNHVHVGLSHLSAITHQKKYINAVGNQAYVLGKHVGDSVLNKVKGSSISFEKAVAANAIDYDDLVAIGGEMNVNGAATTGRRGIVSTAVMNTLQGDARIASGDYHDQLQRGQALRRLTNIAGFEVIDEYPVLPNNNAAARVVTSTNATETLNLVDHGFLTGDKVRFTTSAADLPAGLAVDTTYYVIKVTDDTFKVATTDALATAGTPVALADDGTGVHNVAGWENLEGFFFEDRAFGLKTGLPDQSDDYAKELGILQVNRCKAIQDPETMLGLLSIMWATPGKLDLNCALAILYGSVVGRQAGAKYAMTDRAGLRLVSAA